MPRCARGAGARRGGGHRGAARRPGPRHRGRVGGARRRVRVRGGRQSGDAVRGCSGALIDPEWIVTAKSCFAEGRPGAGRSAVAGDHRHRRQGGPDDRQRGAGARRHARGAASRA
ncbi:trypsin-like serine protease [Nonomuraea thailandensis]